MDGTLIDSANAIYEGFCVAFRKHGQRLPQRERVVALIGGTLEEMFLKNGVSQSEIGSYIQSYKMHYRKISLEQTSLLPTAYEAIMEASKIARLAVVTTKVHASSERLLQRFGVLHCFSCVVGRDDTKEPKPSKEPILKAIQESGGQYRRIFMIGDTPYDILAAKNANIESIAVLSGYSSLEDLQKLTPNITQNALSAVKKIQEWVKK
ncbi:HAD family hydrolase [Helicobacter monodelphidis]|uniref:HAD family hydrolase n=1 Tax=Helicobacter sp. 15-1451 TaxID=2004995 RepID=UPI00215C6D4A|nr:HAD family hydrolase [Helicobacter sp. 15-1451]